MTNRWLKGSAVFASVTVASLALVTPVFANTASFATQYQSKLSQEQTLLTQATAVSSTDTNVTALLAAAQGINTQITSLYTTEQTLASGSSSIPQIDTTHPKETQELKNLQSRRAQLLKQSSNVWKLVVEYSRHPHQKGLLHKAIADHNQIGKQVASVNQQIADLEKKLHTQDWQAHPYNGGLASLQDSILRLEDAAIHYTKQAIALENSSSSSSSSTAGNVAGSGSTNTSGTTSTSTPPASGSTTSPGAN